MIERGGHPTASGARRRPATGNVPTPVRSVTDDERRARLAVRHAVSPEYRVDSVEAAVAAMTALHATEPASVYLSCWARSSVVEVADIERALYDDRTVVKQLAMRRTVFVFPRDLLPCVWPSAAARVAATECGKIVKDVVAAGLEVDGNAWLDRARVGVLDVLADAPDGRSAAEIRMELPMIDARVDTVTGPLALGPRVLTHLGATADIMRGRNGGHWRTSRPKWTLVRNWLGELPPALPAEAGYREIVRRWLFTFGPGSEADIVWWLGATKAVVRTALGEIGAVAVGLEGGEIGWLLPDDVAEVSDPGPWVALLPVLDPTVMGWYGRGFYLGPHRNQVFDSRGNAGTTAWVDGHVVGCWVQDEAAVVSVKLLQSVPTPARKALHAEAARLTEWLGGVRIGTVYPSPAMRA